MEMAGRTAKHQKARRRETDSKGRAFWQEVTPSEIVDTPARGDLICIGCCTLMKRTASYTRKNGTEVPAYLSLYPKDRHAVGCSLSLDKLQASLRRDYPDTISVEDKVLYLHLPDEERKHAVEPNGRRRRGGNTGDRWTNTLSSAATIVRFLRQFDDPGELLNRLKLRYRDHNGNIAVMDWAEFCFEARSTYALRYLRRLQAADRAGRDEGPVAVIFPSKEPRENTTNRFMRVDTYQQPIPGDEKHKLFVSVAETLRPDRRFLTGLSSDILALGRCSYFDWSTGFSVTEVRLQVTNRWQLAQLSDAPETNHQ